jgi:hypothetical protein
MKTASDGLMRAALLSSFMIAVTFGPAASQTIIEMTALKCSDYLDAPSVRCE